MMTSVFPHAGDSEFSWGVRRKIYVERIYEHVESPLFEIFK